MKHNARNGDLDYGDCRADTVAMLVALAGSDGNGAAQLMEQMGVEPLSRAGGLIAGLAGYGIGMTMRIVSKAGVPEHLTKEAARLAIIDWYKQSGSDK